MRLTPVQGSILFFFLAPGTMAGVLPYLLSRGWTFEPAYLGNHATRFVGAALIFAALDIIIDSFARFAIVGQGTPAPTNPTRSLVVSGYYRYVRNPMYVAVASAILGQGLLFGSERVLAYGGLFLVICHAFVVLYEEPTLAKSFPDAFRAYRTNVPRWIPRVTPWHPTQA
jgi:protein-S-isoprenylcysteine O-methyltransferase Ste14